MTQPFESFGFRRFVRRRAGGEAGLLAAAALSVLVAASVVAGATPYLRGLERLGVTETIDAIGPYNKNVRVISRWLPFERPVFEQATDAVEQAGEVHLGDIVRARERVLKSDRYFWGPSEEGLRTATGASKAAFQHLSNLGRQVTFTAGTPPSDGVEFEGDVPVVEAAVYGPRAARLGVSAGDVLDASSIVRGEGLVRVHISGEFIENDRTGEFWLGTAGLFLEPGAPVEGEEQPLPLFVGEEAMFRGVGSQSPGIPATGWWFAYTDTERLKEMPAAAIVRSVEAFEDAVTLELPRPMVLTQLDPAFRAFQKRLLFARVPMFLIAALMLAVVAYYLVMVAGMLAERRAGEVSMLRVRGISAVQILRTSAWEAVWVIGLPALVAPFVAAGAVSQLGRLAAYREVTAGGTLPVTLSWEAFAWAAATGAAAFVVLALPGLLRARLGPAAARQAAARPDRPPFFQRYFLDAIILVLGGLVWWELDTRGSLIASGAGGEAAVDLTLLFAPAVFLIGVALVLLRAFPLLLRAAAWIAGRFGGAWATLALWRLSRSPFWYGWPVLLLVLSSGLAVLAGTMASTLERSTAERIAYVTAADLHVATGPLSRGAAADRQAQVRAVDGTLETAQALRTLAELGTTGLGAEFDFLAVDTEAFARIAWFRDDFSTATLQELMDEVTVPGRPEPILLPADAVEIGAWTKVEPAVSDVFLWLALRDGADKLRTVTLGPVSDQDAPPGEWRLQSAKLPEMKPPMELLSFRVYEPTGPDTGTPFVLHMDDIQVVRLDGAGDRTAEVVIDFERHGGWSGAPTSEGLDVEFTLAPEPQSVGIHRGDRVARLTLGPGTDGGVRGVYRSAAGGPLPVVASPGFLSAAGLREGDSFVVSVAGSLTPLRVAATAEYFPTLFPSRGGFLIGDLDALADYLDQRGSDSGNPNEMFMDLAPELHAQAVEEIKSEFRLARFEDRRQLEADSLIDPLVVAGWRGVGDVALAITVAVAVLGYLTYLRSHARRTRAESAFVRAFGLSRLHYAGVMLVEHLIVGVLGAGLGVASGLWVSRITVASMAHTEKGRELVPPVILQTEWTPVALMFAALAAAGAVAVAVMVRAFARAPLHELTRAEE